MLEITHAERSSVIASKVNQLCSGIEDRRFVSERKRAVGRNLVDGGIAPEDLQEVLVKDLEERWAGLGRIEPSVKRVLSE